MKPEDRNVAPDMERVFQPVSSNRFHVDAATNISKQFEAYLQKICASIASAWGMWMNESCIQGLVVMGPTATIIPGTVTGPGMQGLIMASDPPIQSPQERGCTVAIAKAFGMAWGQWSFELSGVLPVVHCAAFPGPMAPPLPNIPVLVSTLQSAGEGALQKEALTQSMINNYQGSGHFSHDIFSSVAQAISEYFPGWKNGTNVINVLAGGPVPSFAPPLSPAGPVIGGIGVGAACFL